MATKQFYATGSFKYGTRMLRAGDPVDLDGPSARLFTALGKISPDKPKSAATQSDLNAMTKAELAKLAGLTPEAAKNLTKAQILATL